MRAFALAAATAAAFSTLAFVSERAEARIACDGPYQMVQGSLLATPYCEDNYLASVARGYGMRVSDVSVRQNPGVKGEVCRAFGHDSRIAQICSNYLPSDRGRGIRPF